MVGRYRSWAAQRPVQKVGPGLAWVPIILPESKWIPFTSTPNGAISKLELSRVVDHQGPPRIIKGAVRTRHKVSMRHSQPNTQQRPWPSPRLFFAKGHTLNTLKLEGSKESAISWSEALHHHHHHPFFCSPQPVAAYERTRGGEALSRERSPQQSPKCPLSSTHTKGSTISEGAWDAQGWWMIHHGWMCPKPLPAYLRSTTARHCRVERHFFPSSSSRRKPRDGWYPTHHKIPPEIPLFRQGYKDTRVERVERVERVSTAPSALPRRKGNDVVHLGPQPLISSVRLSTRPNTLLTPITREPDMKPLKLNATRKICLGSPSLPMHCLSSENKRHLGTMLAND